MTTDDVRIRLAQPTDADAIIDICAAALGWSDPAFDRELFRWKHFSNAFGPSIIVLAENERGLLAVRPLMRWRFRQEGRTVEAARAVDTATHPDAQGRGLFRTLTMHGLDELERRSFGFVFNTPNEKSRPGYLKMGWESVGRIGFGFSVASPLRLARMARSRTAAQKRSIATPDLGLDIAEGVASIDENSLRARGRPLQTDHSAETLLWRFHDGPIEYRWLPTSEHAGCVVRLRRRGVSRELVVAHHVGDASDPAAWATVRSAMRQTNADYCLTPAGFGSAITVGRLGPELTLRRVGEQPGAHDFAWTPGDIELF